jgi:hypothetical protein
MLIRIHVVLLSLVALCFGVSTSAEEAARTPGHSAHGEAFNEGARQAAYLMGGTGRVHFKITTSKPEVQQYFDQGLGQYYGFWYFESERSFRLLGTRTREL